MVEDPIIPDLDQHPKKTSLQRRPSKIPQVESESVCERERVERVGISRDPLDQGIDIASEKA